MTQAEGVYCSMLEINIRMFGSILFHGAHDPGKVRGTIELRIHPDIQGS
ncbi:MAG: hypothetical protein MZV64_51240 [Ignavibacteriales bacterium]|nr:hypothetical protein [Ignavibacteriales bacterium]